jgi:tryptophan synthase alpha chain
VNRIDERLYSLQKTGQKALITFITAGDPDPETTGELVVAMERAGADIVELGIPYSDPLADGPVIQRASARALKAGIKIDRIMDIVKSVRKTSDIPLVYLVYYNSVFRYGPERFTGEAREAGVDGLIIPDLPVEERREMADIVSSRGMHLIPLVAPTSHERIKNIVEGAGGFVYCISTKGVTGVREEIETDIKAYMEEVSRYTALPRALGFGISGPDMAKRFRDYCEGVIVGSAIVRLIEQGKDRRRMLSNVCEFVSRIKEVL